MQKTVVLNVVGLTKDLIGQYTPYLSHWLTKGKQVAIEPVLPAVTCTVQSTYLTGKYPDEHGIVANGWYFRDDCEVKFWRQSNKLVQAPKIWDIAREIDPTFTCANMFWWYNMYSTADYEVTPRPMYPADGRKLPDINTKPASLRPQLQETLGQFPLFKFWGPVTSIESSQWIAASAKWVDAQHNPTLTLVYLPHLDYCCQKVGSRPEHIETDLQEIDQVCGDLIDYYEARGAQVIVLSEYGIQPVSKPVHLNRILREKGFIAVREELGKELLDAGASKAFAVADHQIAHIYVDNPSEVSQVQALLETVDGVSQVLDEEGKQNYHLDHPRSGELIALAEPNAWFTYYYWLDDSRAPDFARTVDIHRKPGYDPAEMFIDPTITLAKPKIAGTLLKKKLGFRTLMEFTPLDASLVKGSHGALNTNLAEGPLLISQQTQYIASDRIEAVDVCDIILDHLLVRDR
ncbi:Type I phosphodiesterase / nucleotide pyrophosphatase superfamily [Synechococcus sp. PCC 7335]|uniref:alkaline phosphatase family protein n=1 Tax=Synechococcus sp. (strain ATCC 29403 / PCC 7335) TaxID=91464 RepID=UPI00017ECA8B|nr:nucleotide pyrophosphatase/phosphodiesterase family protein [Synechococcus sp. PCC 7335]EDX87457.1 Type I phosphodiesterase / nucleotide pyrophosphatase superfamily [Synechococcus sp. PCC 7335]